MPMCARSRRAVCPPGAPAPRSGWRHVPRKWRRCGSPGEIQPAHDADLLSHVTMHLEPFPDCPPPRPARSGKPSSSSATRRPSSRRCGGACQMSRRAQQILFPVRSAPRAQAFHRRQFQHDAQIVQRPSKRSKSKGPRLPAAARAGVTRSPRAPAAPGPTAPACGSRPAARRQVGLGEALAGQQPEAEQIVLYQLIGLVGQGCPQRQRGRRRLRLPCMAHPPPGRPADRRRSRACPARSGSRSRRRRPAR